VREYLQQQIGYVKGEIEGKMQRYRELLDGIRETSLKYFSEEDVQKKTDGQYLDPHGINDDTDWVAQIIRRSRECKTDIWGHYKTLRALLEVLRELEKYEPAEAVSLDDAARQIHTEWVRAKSKARGLTLKKQAAEKDMWIAVADAYYNSLLKMGYDENQIEGMGR